MIKCNGWRLFLGELPLVWIGTYTDESRARRGLLACAVACGARQVAGALLRHPPELSAEPAGTSVVWGVRARIVWP